MPFWIRRFDLDKYDNHPGAGLYKYKIVLTKKDFRSCIKRVTHEMKIVLWICMEDVVMTTVKERVKMVIDDMPDDVSFDEILQELAFQLMIDRGIADSDGNRVITDIQLESEIEAW